MIIPTLLAQQVRTDDPSRPDASDEEDDGLSPEERANIARSLEALSGAQNVGGPSSMVGQRVTPQAPVASISQMLGGSAGSQGDSAGRQGGKAPPTVVRATPPAGVPISVPVNRSLAGVVEAPAPALAAVESPADAGGPAKPEKKMSRCAPFARIFCSNASTYPPPSCISGLRRGSLGSSRAGVGSERRTCFREEQQPIGAFQSSSPVLASFLLRGERPRPLSAFSSSDNPAKELATPLSSRQPIAAEDIYPSLSTHLLPLFGRLETRLKCAQLSSRRG